MNTGPSFFKLQKIKLATVFLRHGIYILSLNSVGKQIIPICTYCLHAIVSSLHPVKTVKQRSDYADLFFLLFVKFVILPKFPKMNCGILTRVNL